MAKPAPTLDTPFRRGERVLTTRSIGGRPDGDLGKVKLTNGLDSGWNRYWVRFADGKIIGQIDHHDLVRPNQLDEWKARVEAKANAVVGTIEATAADAPAASAGDGVASLIPAAILERSKAAKARLLGG